MPLMRFRCKEMGRNIGAIEAAQAEGLFVGINARPSLRDL